MNRHGVEAPRDFEMAIGSHNSGVSHYNFLKCFRIYVPFFLGLFLTVHVAYADETHQRQSFA